MGEKCKICENNTTTYCIHCFRYELNRMIDAYFDDFFEPIDNCDDANQGRE